MLKKEKEKIPFSDKLLIIFLLTLIFVGIGLIAFKYLGIYQKQNYEEKKINDFFEKYEEIDTNSNLSDIPILEELEVNELSYQYKPDDYIAVIEIPKISLKRGLYKKESSYNHVDKNIEILKESDMPNVPKGNLILVGHSGNSRISYFKNLKNLETNDIAYIYYNNQKFNYILVNIYEVDKTGTVNIVRNGEKNTLTLITCKDNSDKQLVYIFELLEGDE